MVELVLKFVGLADVSRNLLLPCCTAGILPCLPQGPGVPNKTCKAACTCWVASVWSDIIHYVSTLLLVRVSVHKAMLDKAVDGKSKQVITQLSTGSICMRVWL